MPSYYPSECLPRWRTRDLYGDTGYEVVAASAVRIDGSQVSYKDVPGYEVPETSVPMTVGRDGDDPQEGVSDNPLQKECDYPYAPQQGDQPKVSLLNLQWRQRPKVMG